MLFFFTATATTQIYTLSLHDALPISARAARTRNRGRGSIPSSPATAGRGLRSSGRGCARDAGNDRSEEHTSELQSHSDLVCRLLLEKKKKNIAHGRHT